MAKKEGKNESEEQKDDFRYIVRIANTDLDGDKAVVLALTQIKGIGNRTAEVITRELGVPSSTKIGTLSEEKTDEIAKLLTEFSEKAPSWLLNRQNDFETGEDLHLISTEVALTLRDDINLLKKIRSYRGIRHESGHKVRGQRTRSNGRTGLTLGVSRKK